MNDPSMLPGEDNDCPLSHSEMATLFTRVRIQERKRIARELHDELGQQLSALQHGLGVLRIQLRNDRPELIEHIEDLLRISHTATDAIRDLHSTGPTAPLPDELTSALRNLVDNFRQLSGITCHYSLPTQPINLEADRAAHMYRVVQESLSNILRHAKASRAAVMLEQRENDYVLEISDDGCGFALSNILPDSTGLSGMRERGKQLGGPVVIFSHPGQGTLVQAIFPIKISI